MSVGIRLMDSRIDGARAKSGTDVLVTPMTSMSDVLDRVEKAAGGRSIHLLAIMAHGRYFAGEHPEEAMSVYSGGFGLSLGADDLWFSTVHRFSRLADDFTDDALIELLACGAAQRTPIFDWEYGRTLCKELAAYTGVTVRAAEKKQRFKTTYRSEWFGLKKTTDIDFGPWEGPVHLFHPDGTVERDRSPGERPGPFGER